MCTGRAGLPPSSFTSCSLCDKSIRLLHWCQIHTQTPNWPKLQRYDRVFSNCLAINLSAHTCWAYNCLLLANRNWTWTQVMDATLNRLHSMMDMSWLIRSWKSIWSLQTTFWNVCRLAMQTQIVKVSTMMDKAVNTLSTLVDILSDRTTPSRYWTYTHTRFASQVRRLRIVRFIPPICQCLSGLMLICSDKENKCHDQRWAWEHIIGYHLVPQNETFSRSSLNFIRHKQVKNVRGAIQCGQLCINEEVFVCRSALYNAASMICELSNVNRHTLESTQVESVKHNRLKFVQTVPFSHDIHYLENKCINEPRKFCDFRRITNQRLKTVDNVRANVQSASECRELCLASTDVQCMSYEYEPNLKLCRLSHLSELTTWHTRPYLEQEGAVTYEISTCYNGNDTGSVITPLT